MSRAQLYVEALHLNPNLSAAYNDLGTLYVDGLKSATLRNGRRYRASDLFIQAIRCDPTNTLAFSNLAALTPPGSKVTLADGRTLTGKQLLAAALAIDPTLETFRTT